MRLAVTLILFLVTLALDATLSPRIALWGAPPDLMVILLVQVAFQLPRPENIIWPCVFGLGTDLHEDGPVGVLTLTFALLGIAIDRFQNAFFTEGLLVRVAAAGIAVFVRNFAVMISEVLRGQPPPFMLFWGQAFLSILYTAVLALALLPLLEWVLGRFTARKRRD